MKQLKRWVQNHTRLTFIGIAAIVLIIIIGSSVSGGGASTRVGRFFQNTLTVIQKPFVKIGSGISNGLSGIFTDDELKAENEELKAQIENLESELIEARLDEVELAELKKLQEAFGGDAGMESKYRVVSANVLSYEGSNAFSVFSIDLGAEDGVKRDSIVVTGDGLVGRVYDTGKGWSKVVSIISDSNNVGFQVYPEMKYIGVCRGDGKGGLVGEMLDENAVVEKGQKVFTSGIGGIYPPGLEIGTITKVEHEDGGSLLKVKIEPSVYFKGLKKVGVLL